ncbi:MAG: hypothetical protein ABFQ95_06315 [Pseudomonadota bacterium]
MKKSILVLSMSCLLVLAGCGGSGRTMVLNKPTERHMAKSYNLVEGDSTVDCDVSVKKLFEQEINKGLADAHMAKGQDLKIEYRFIQFNEGSRLARYASRGIGDTGEGEMTVEVIFKDKDNKELNKLHVGGKVSSGFLGGSFDNAVELSAQQVVKYVVANFKSVA